MRHAFYPVASSLDGRYSMDVTKTGETLIGAYPREIQNVHFSLGLACTFACGHCPVNEREGIAARYESVSKELGIDLGNPIRYTDPELVAASLDILSGTEQIGLGCGGGEPLMHPQYEMIINTSRDFFAARAERVPSEERLFWWTRPLDYNSAKGRTADVHRGGRVVVFTNAVRMPQDRKNLKQYLLEHPFVTFEVSYDGFHEESYRQHGLDLRTMISHLDALAGDEDVRSAGVQIYLFHVGNERADALERTFPHCLVDISSVVKFTPEAPGGRAMRRGRLERHVISDSQGNIFHSFNDVYSGNLARLCGKIRNTRSE